MPCGHGPLDSQTLAAWQFERAFGSMRAAGDAGALPGVRLCLLEDGEPEVTVAPVAAASSMTSEIAAAAAAVADALAEVRALHEARAARMAAREVGLSQLRPSASLGAQAAATAAAAGVASQLRQLAAQTAAAAAAKAGGASSQSVAAVARNSQREQTAAAAAAGALAAAEHHAKVAAATATASAAAESAALAQRAVLVAASRAQPAQPQARSVQPPQPRLQRRTMSPVEGTSQPELRLEPESVKPPSAALLRAASPREAAARSPSPPGLPELWTEALELIAAQRADPRQQWAEAAGALQRLTAATSAFVAQVQPEGALVVVACSSGPASASPAMMGATLPPSAAAYSLLSDAAGSELDTLVGSSAKNPGAHFFEGGARAGWLFEVAVACSCPSPSPSTGVVHLVLAMDTAPQLYSRQRAEGDALSQPLSEQDRAFARSVAAVLASTLESLPAAVAAAAEARQAAFQSEVAAAATQRWRLAANSLGAVAGLRRAQSTPVSPRLESAADAVKTHRAIRRAMLAQLQKAAAALRPRAAAVCAELALHAAAPPGTGRVMRAALLLRGLSDAEAAVWAVSLRTLPPAGLLAWMAELPAHIDSDGPELAPAQVAAAAAAVAGLKRESAAAETEFGDVGARWVFSFLDLCAANQTLQQARSAAQKEAAAHQSQSAVRARSASSGASWSSALQEPPLPAPEVTTSAELPLDGAAGLEASPAATDESGTEPEAEAADGSGFPSPEADTFAAAVVEGHTELEETGETEDDLVQAGVTAMHADADAGRTETAVDAGLAPSTKATVTQESELHPIASYQHHDAAPTESPVAVATVAGPEPGWRLEPEVGPSATSLARPEPTSLPADATVSDELVTAEVISPLRGGNWGVPSDPQSPQLSDPDEEDAMRSLVADLLTDAELPTSASSNAVVEQLTPAPPSHHRSKASRPAPRRESGRAAGDDAPVAVDMEMLAAPSTTTRGNRSVAEMLRTPPPSLARRAPVLDIAEEEELAMRRAAI